MSQGKAVWTGDKLDQVLRRREGFSSHIVWTIGTSHTITQGVCGFFFFLSSFLSFLGSAADDIRLTILPGVTS